MTTKWVKTSLIIGIMATFASPSFAARQSVAGPGVTAIDATGMLNGVDMTGSATTGTLTIGTVGGAQTDIFSANNPLGTVAGIAVSTDVSSSSNIVFNSSSNVYGDIGVTNPGGPFFLNIDAGADNSVVTFLGSVFGTTLDVTQTGTVNFNNGANNITATNFAGDGTISLAPNTTVVGALTTTAGANTGTLKLGGGSTLDGAVGGAIGIKAIDIIGAGVSATITGAANAFVFSLGNNTLNVGGSLTIANLAPSGVINTIIDSATQYGHIISTGASNLGAALLVNVSIPTTTYIPAGSLFTIVQAGSGTDNSVVTVLPDNPLYTFSVVPVTGTVHGQVEIKADGTPLTSVVSPVVPVLVVIPPTPDLINVLAPINALTTKTAVASALAQLAPSTPDLVAPLITFQGTRQFENLWSSRLDDVRCDDATLRIASEKVATCKRNEPRNGWWLKSFGAFSQQDTRNNINGYKANDVGLMGAYDAALSESTRAGVGVGYARNTINEKTFNNNTGINTYQATAYIGHNNGPWFVNADMSVGLHDYSGSRRIVFPGVDRTAHAQYDGRDYTAFVAMGYNASTSGGVTITPIASLQFTRMNLDSYTETGAGDIDLKVKSQRYDFAESGLGVKISHATAFTQGIFVPEIHAKWLHELNNPNLKNTAAYDVVGSPSFTTSGLKTSDNTGNVGAGFTVISLENSSVEAMYDYNWNKDGYNANQLSMKYTSRF